MIGHLLNLGGDPEYGTVLDSNSVLAAHVLLDFALVALYSAQAERSGVPGILGMVLGVTGTTLVCEVVLVEVGIGAALGERHVGGANSWREP